MAKRSLASERLLLALRGNRCGFAYPGWEKAWRLPASINGIIDVDCTIPRGKLLAVPVAGLVVWGKSPERLRAELDPLLAYLTRTELVLDGRSLGSGHEVESYPHIVTIGPRNPFGEPAGTYTFLAHDYLAILTEDVPRAVGFRRRSGDGFSHASVIATSLVEMRAASA
ncbi:MAG: hypothetical protein IT201_05480 [Thermoleophilia bacterium]|nr:hypothetical protein [Thermoleophilia bacterium]